ncbi:MAG: putative transcriptional regulator, partial [Planctomycetota bacterium]
GNVKVYRPQFLKENNAFVQLVASELKQPSVKQYKREERSLLAKRATSEKKRLRQLIVCMRKDEISQPEKIKELKNALLDLTGDINFKKSKNMGQILDSALHFIVRNYQSVNPFLR